MNAIQFSPRKTDLTVTYVLAELLERLQAGCGPLGAEQYCSVVLHSHAAAAKFYENVNYQCAGLCRCALDASLAAEQQAKQALDRAMHRAMGHSTIQSKEDSNHGKS